MADFEQQNAADLAEDARRLLNELDTEVPAARGMSGECRPAVDVVETASSIELLVDVPGIRPDSLRVVIRRNAVLIVGVKLPSVPEPGGRIHVAERSYGRFARVVRLTPAVDAAHARAVASGGQLRVILPRQVDRRGGLVTVPVEFA
jgi:HSP20 family protein